VSSRAQAAVGAPSGPRGAVQRRAPRSAPGLLGRALRAVRDTQRETPSESPHGPVTATQLRHAAGAGVSGTLQPPPPRAPARRVQRFSSLVAEPETPPQVVWLAGQRAGDSALCGPVGGKVVERGGSTYGGVTVIHGELLLMAA
jgi:hypothetical protein